MDFGTKKVVKANKYDEDMMTLLNLTLLLLQNSCEGQFKEMKDFLRS